MKIAAAVHRVTGNTKENLTTILSMAGEAAEHGAELVLFSEAALTGLINNDDPEHDLSLAQPIPGPVTDKLSGLCIEKNIWLATGLLERDGNALYDSAILIDPEGMIRLKYRRISPGWHGPNVSGKIYRQGNELTTIGTSFGTFAFLICGDLFDDTLADQVRALKPGLLLFPFARCFASDADVQRRWDNEERRLYIDRVKRIGTTAIMTNYLSDTMLDPPGKAFGGAMTVMPDGTVAGSLPLGTTGILYTDIQPQIYQ